MPKKDTRSNIAPEYAGVNPPAEIRTIHFPTACTLLAYGEIMVSCCPIGRMSEFVFAPTPTALRIVEDIRNNSKDILVPLKRYMECYDIMRDAQKKRREWPVGIQLFAPVQR